MQPLRQKKGNFIFHSLSEWGETTRKLWVK
jgi:hypothetical protein